MNRIPTRLLILALFCAAAPAVAGQFFNKSVSDWYIGGRVGRVSGNAESSVNTFGYGADVGMRIAKSAHLSLQYQGNPHPDKNGSVIHSLTPGLEFFPFSSMSEMRTSLGLGLGAYQMTGPTRMSDLGINFGLGIDVMLGNFRVGMVSRYNAMLHSAKIPDFWSFMFRVGMEING